jgi:hypothetical protein
MPIVQVVPYVPGSTTYGSVDVNVQFRDNILATYSGGRAPAALELTNPDPGFISNHNLYYLPNITGGSFLRSGGSAFSLAAWQNSTGYDANSIVGNPNFNGGTLTELNNMVPGTPSSLTACVAEAISLIAALQLSATSPAIDAGVNLAVSLNYDFFGNFRPADGNSDGGLTTDIGAFEYGATNIINPAYTPVATFTPIPTSTFAPYAILQNKELTAFPNPAKKLITFVWSEINVSQAKIAIYNVAGDLIVTLRTDNPQQMISWDLQGKAPGIYIACISLTINGAEKRKPRVKFAIIH